MAQWWCASRVTVVSRVCGCALFDWVAEAEVEGGGGGGSGARWSSAQLRASAPAGVLQTFHQLAKDLGGTSHSPHLTPLTHAHTHQHTPPHQHHTTPIPSPKPTLHGPLSGCCALSLVLCPPL